MGKKITDANDYVNSLRWVSDAKQSKHALYESTHCLKIPVLLQVDQTKGGNLDGSSTEQLASCSHDEMSTRWQEICQ
jgi:hypothetical protein